jgi:hypothetical protein
VSKTDGFAASKFSRMAPAALAAPRTRHGLASSERGARTLCAIPRCELARCAGDERRRRAALGRPPRGRMNSRQKSMTV